MVTGAGSIFDIRSPDPEVSVKKASSETLRTELSGYSDIGEDYGEDGESIQFVDQAQMDAVKKEIQEQYRVNDSLRSLITDVSEELNNFREFMSPGDCFSYNTYKDDLEKNVEMDKLVR